MKKLFPLLFLGSIVIFSGCSQSNNSLYQYPFKTAKITYAISGTTEGSATVLIKGDESVREAHVVFHKPTGDEKQDNLYIDTGKNVISVDLDKKQAAETPNPLYAALINVPPSQRQDFLKKIAVGFSPDESATQQIQPTGTNNVAGQDCQIFDTGGFGTICLWNNIPLKTNISIPSLGLSNNTVATSVQTDIDIPDSSFDVPAGITVQQIGVDGQTVTPVPYAAPTQQLMPAPAPTQQTKPKGVK